MGIKIFKNPPKPCNRTSQPLPPWRIRFPDSPREPSGRMRGLCVRWRLDMRASAGPLEPLSDKQRVS